MKKKLILATTSPYRIKAFAELGIPFQAIDSRIDENFDKRPTSASDLVYELAKRKAEAVAEHFNKRPRIIIGFDSVGFFGGKILEKPKSREEAFVRLKLLSGELYRFYTGISMIDIQLNGRWIVTDNLECTDLKMRYYSDDEIEKYLDQDPNFSTYALGFNPFTTLGSSFIEWNSGCYNNLIHGIPLATIIKMIQRTGFKI